MRRRRECDVGRLQLATPAEFRVVWTALCPSVRMAPRGLHESSMVDSWWMRFRSEARPETGFGECDGQAGRGQQHRRRFASMSVCRFSLAASSSAG